VRRILLDFNLSCIAVKNRNYNDKAVSSGLQRFRFTITSRTSDDHVSVLTTARITTRSLSLVKIIHYAQGVT